MAHRLAVEGGDEVARSQPGEVRGRSGVDARDEHLGRAQASVGAQASFLVDARFRDQVGEPGREQAHEGKPRNGRAAQVDDVESMAAIELRAQCRPVLDRLAIDADDEIRGLQSGMASGRRGIDDADQGREGRLCDPDQALGGRQPVAGAYRLLQWPDVALELAIASLESKPQLFADVLPDDRLELFPVANGGPLHRYDAVTRLDSGAGRGAVAEHVADHRRGQPRLPGEEHEVDEDGQDQVGRGASEDDHQALQDGFGVEGPASVLDRHLVLAVLAQDAHVAAERNQRQLVLGLAPGESHEWAAEPQRESEDTEVQQLGGEEVPELVNHHERAHHEKEKDDRHCRTNR